MADRQWQKVREIFDAALRQKPELRPNYINQACGDDKSLLAEVESLLSSLDSAENFMETPAVAKVAESIGDNGKKLEKGQFSRALRNTRTNWDRRNGRSLFGGR